MKRSQLLLVLSVSTNVNCFLQPITPLTTDSIFKPSKSAVKVAIIEKEESEEDLAEASAPGYISPSTALFAAAGLGMFTKAAFDLEKDLNAVSYISNTYGHQLKEFATFFDGNEFWSLLLMFTHAFPFVIVPLTMKQINEKATDIKQDFPKFNPFVMNLGLASVGFGLALEFGWHCTSAWYYVNNFHILNFGFYFFFISGFALWADGFGQNKQGLLRPNASSLAGKINWDSQWWNAVFALILLAATIAYPIGSGIDAHQGHGHVTDTNAYKAPLYAGLTATFTIISARGHKILGNPMWLVPLFSVGVNMAFIFFLQGLTPPPLDCTQADLFIENYQWHIGHDLLGTELGVIIFAYLISQYEPQSQK